MRTQGGEISEGLHFMYDYGTFHWVLSPYQKKMYEDIMFVKFHFGCEDRVSVLNL